MAAGSAVAGGEAAGTLWGEGAADGDRQALGAQRRAGSCTPRRAVAGYMAASIGMVVANKRALGLLRAGTVLLEAQLLATCLAVLALAAVGLLRVSGSLDGAARWAPTGVLSGLILWAGMEALKRASLSTLTVVRNASPLFLLMAEWLAFGARPSCGKVLSLVLILAGVCIYAWEDLQDTDPWGVFFIALDAFLVCVDSLLERYLLALRPINLSTGACVLVTNSVGMIPVLLLLAGPLSHEWSELTVTRAGMAWGLVTLPGGIAMAFLGIWLRCVVSATGALVVANVDKVLVLVYGVAVMGDRLDGLRGVGCLLSLVGGAWHALARALPASGPGARGAAAAEECVHLESMAEPLHTPHDDERPRPGQRARGFV